MESDKKEVKEIKPLTTAEIREHIGTSSDEGEFPSWAVKKYATTHKLRWISQRKFYGENMQVDTRGFEVVKNPKTAQIQRWKEMVLGAMPLDLAEERKLAVEELTKSQEQAVVDNIEGRQEQLQHEISRSGYASKGKPRFDYKSTKSR
jgi:hypothetical protein